MKEIVAKLLIDSGYIKRDPINPNLSDAYLNRNDKDCIIISEYDVESLTNFDNSDSTKAVMKVFEETRIKEDIYKNTSLIITLKLNRFSDYELIKNIVLNVEENPYAFRKYVAVYTDKGVSGLKTDDNIKQKLETILLDETRFKDFEEGKDDDEFRTILELFVKLPFMSIRGMPSIELADFLSPLDLPENLKLKEIFLETINIFDSDKYLSPDEEISRILSVPKVKNYSEERDYEV